ncbi:MAG TPA: hypothetical protein VGT41_03340 [Candidatus Babeliales bacterium]|nr:hypothetical protein [Candidatus Babeliales bacterium]
MAFLYIVALVVSFVSGLQGRDDSNNSSSCSYSSKMTLGPDNSSSGLSLTVTTTSPHLDFDQHVREKFGQTGYQICRDSPGYNQARSHFYQELARAYTYSCIKAEYLKELGKTINLAEQKLKVSDDFKDSFQENDQLREACAILQKAFGGLSEQHAYESIFRNGVTNRYGRHCTSQQLLEQQCAQMREWSQYKYPAFVKCIRTFACYNRYIEELADEFRHNRSLADQVKRYAPEAYDLVTRQAQDIKQKRHAAAERERERYKHEQEKKERALHLHNDKQHHLIAKDFFNEQHSMFDDHLEQWQETHPERVAAYQEAIRNNAEVVGRRHEMCNQAERWLRNNGKLPVKYTAFRGHTLQQQLHSEIVDGVEILSQLPACKNPESFERTMRKATLDTLEDARQINAIGDCFGAGKLIDFGMSLLGYCAAAVGGFSSGVCKGIKKTGTDIAHIACHPDRLVMALGLVAVQFGDLIYNYVPFDDEFGSTFDEQDWDRISKNWAELGNKVVNWWEKTPSHDKVHQVVEAPVGFFTNAILFGCCASFASKIATAACAEAVALVRKQNPTIASVGAATADSGVASAVSRAKGEAASLLEKLSEAEKAVQASALKKKPKNPPHIKQLLLQDPPIVNIAWQATREAIEAGVKYVMEVKKNVKHVFEGKHKLGNVVEQAGGQEKFIRTLLESLSDKIPADGIFDNFRAVVAGQEVIVRGIVMDGIAKISTCFIEKLKA